MVTYLSYFRNLQSLSLDIETGMQEVVGDFPGMTFAPRFSLKEKNNNEFCKRWKFRYLYNGFRKQNCRKITNHPSIDTSPSYSPDGIFVLILIKWLSTNLYNEK